VGFWTGATPARAPAPMRSTGPPPPPALADVIGLPVTAGSDEALASIVAELAPMGRVWQQLLIEHGPEPGGRCRGCTQGGTGLPDTIWPCALYTVAHLAFHHPRDAGRSAGEPAGEAAQAGSGGSTREGPAT
jgi:hypothetical protein